LESALRDRRRLIRWELFRIGELRLEELSYPVGCLVLNVSSTGALIEVGDTGVVPDHFWLRVRGASVDRKCDVVRRERRRLAVSFTD
jgi:PilZ domain-containing protein